RFRSARGGDESRGDSPRQTTRQEDRSVRCPGPGGRSPGNGRRGAGSGAGGPILGRTRRLATGSQPREPALSTGEGEIEAAVAAGSSSRKTVQPSRRTYISLPPIAWASWWDTARPRPVDPGGPVVAKGVKIRAATSGSTPAPLSLTSNHPVPAPCPTSTSTSG